MVIINNPIIEELIEKLVVLKENSNRIRDIQKQGVISKRFADYCEQLLMLDHLAEEAEAFAELKNLSFKESLLEMRLILDSVAGPYVMEFIEKPFLYDNHRELYLFARERYDSTINNVTKILRGCNVK